MNMDQILPAFFEELEKLAVSKRESPFMQARRNRRPIRAHTLLKKEMAFGAPASAAGDSGESEGNEYEHGGGMEEKVGARKEPFDKKVIRNAVAARPWISSAVKGAIPGAVAANFLIPATATKALKYKSRIVAGAGVLGAGMGVTDRALKRWARKHPRSKAAIQLKKQGSALLMRKVAAMAGDLRMKGLGDVKRPAFATEDSKKFSFNQLKNSKAPGYFTTHTQAKHLRRPGPSIQQVSPIAGR